MKLVKDSVIVYAGTKAGKKLAHPKESPFINPFKGITSDWKVLSAVYGFKLEQANGKKVR